MSSSRWWRFYVDSYFPYMYGLMLIEKHCEENNQSDKMSTMKREFTQETIQYLERKQIFYIESELEEILKFNISKEYSKVLLKDFYKWRGKMEDILEIIHRILEA